MAIYPHAERYVYEAAVSGDPRLALRAAVARQLEAGADRHEILAELESLADQYAAEHLEREENIVLDVMDALTGAAHPSVRL